MSNPYEQFSKKEDGNPYAKFDKGSSNPYAQFDEGTSLGEDFKIGWANVGKIFQDAAEVGTSGLMGALEKLPGADPEKNLERFQKIHAAGEKTKKDLDTWANPEDKQQSFGGKAVSVLGSLPGQIAAMPFSPAQTGKDFIDAGESADTAQKAAMIDTAGNVVGTVLPGTMGKTVGKKVLSGFGINAAQDLATRAGISGIAETDKAREMYKPTAETTALAGLVGSGVGGVHAVAGRETADPAKEKDPVPTSNEDAPIHMGEKELVQNRMEEAKRQIARSEYQIRKIEKQFNDPTLAQRSPEAAEQLKQALLEEVEQHQKDIQRHQETRANGEAILRGEEPTATTKPPVEEQVPFGGMTFAEAKAWRDSPEGQAWDAEMKAKADAISEQQKPTDAGQVQVSLLKQNLDSLKDYINDPDPTVSSLAQKAQETVESLSFAKERGDNIAIRRLTAELDDKLNALVKATEPPRIDVDETSPELGTQISEEIEIRPIEDTRPISELDLDTINDRIGEVKDGIRDQSEFDALIKRRAELENAEFMGPERQVIIKGGTKEERASFKAMLDEVGLGAEKIDVNLSDGTIRARGGFGESYAEGDVGKINVAPIKSFKELLDASPKLRETLDNLPPEQRPRFEKLITSAHEIGHMMLYKLLQTGLYKDDLNVVIKAYDAWMKTSPKEAAASARLYYSAGPKLAAYYSQFPEFFAQRVARNLLLGEKAPSDAISKFVKGFKNVFNTLRSKFKVSIAANNVVDDLINRIISDNKVQLEKTGQTIFEIASTKMALEDAQVMHNKKFNYKTYDNLNGAGAPNMSYAPLHIQNADEVIQKQLAQSKDMAPTGTGTIFKELIGLIKNWSGSNLFGLQQKKGIYSDSPVIVHTVNTILDAVSRQTQRSMELLSGVTDRTAWNAKRKGFMVSLQKVKNNDSPSIVFEKSSNEDFHVVHKVLEQGVGTHDYAESLAQFGGHLTPQQKVLFNTLAKMYKKMYKMAAGLEGELGKKAIIPKMKGWMPAVRRGEFVVNFYRKGMNIINEKLPDGTRVMTDLMYSQTFRTREEADAFIKHFEKQSPEFKGKLKHNGVEEVGQSELPNTLADFHKAYQEQLDRVAEQGGNIDEAKEQFQRMHNQFIVRGGTLGSHHKMRTNVPGAMGSEMFGTVGDAGKAFRDAQFAAVDEYTRLMMKMEIGEKLDLVLNNDEIQKNFPNTHKAAQLMRDYALNEVKTPMQMKGLKRLADKIWSDSYTDKSKIRKFIGAHKYPDAYLTDVFQGKATHLFYIFNLTMRPAFWAAQGSQFMWTARSLVKDGVGPIDSMTAAGKGIMKAMKPDRELLDSLFYASQNTHTFSPQFINDLNKFHVLDFLKEGSTSRTLIDLVTGEIPSRAADTFSRLVSFAMMHEHYKDLGYTGTELARKAAEATDENMVQYGRQYKAPIFQKMGMVGDLLSPLQTFPQAALGNLIADVNLILRTSGGKAKLQASLPFMMTMGITSLMAGVIGAPLVMEWEVFSRFMNALAEKLGMEARLPSFIDLVLEGDNTFSNRVLSHGLISASTMAINDEGFDIGSSTRWQALFNGAMTGEKSFMEMVPVINWVFDEVGNAKTIVENATGLKDHTEAEIRTAKLGLSPGWTKGLTDDYLGAATREMVPTNKGQAFIPQTGAERASKYLGTSTLNASTERMRNRRMAEQKMRNDTKISQEIKLITDSVQKGNLDAAKARAKRLAEKYQLEGDEIERKVETELFARKIPETKRKFVSKSGTSSLTQQREYQRYMDLYNDSPFDQEEEQQ